MAIHAMPLQRLLRSEKSFSEWISTYFKQSSGCPRLCRPYLATLNALNTAALPLILQAVDAQHHQ